MGARPPAPRQTRGTRRRTPPRLVPAATRRTSAHPQSLRLASPSTPGQDHPGDLAAIAACPSPELQVRYPECLDMDGAYLDRQGTGIRAERLLARRLQGGTGYAALNEAFSPEPEIMIWGIVFRGGVRRLWLGNLWPVDDPQPGAVGLAAQHLDPHAGVVGRAGRGQRQVLGGRWVLPAAAAAARGWRGTGLAWRRGPPWGGPRTSVRGLVAASW